MVFEMTTTGSNPASQQFLFQLMNENKKEWKVRKIPRKFEEWINFIGDEAWNLTFDIAASCGRAYTERHILEEFSKDIKKCQNLSLIPILEKLRSLYALWTISNEPRYKEISLNFQNRRKNRKFTFLKFLIFL